jgi:LmbE family N-acetylglucosaminyl deacetylase
VSILAREHLAFPELFPEYAPHQVREVYLVQWELTDTMEVKLKAIACHVRQVSDLKAVEARMRTRAAALGKAKGHTYAEGFDHVLLPG